MKLLNRVSTILEHPALYRAWQIPFAGSKIAALRRHNDFSSLGRVLDVGCGPAMNTAYFRDMDYLGIDISDRYIENARRRFKKEFVVADVRTYTPPNDESFDFVLLNSLLHHLNDHDAGSVVAQLPKLVSHDGHVHILDLVMPQQSGVAHWLADHDRGDYPRKVEEWHALFCGCFKPVVFEPFSIRFCGLEILKMVYFKGAPLLRN